MRDGNRMAMISSPRIEPDSGSPHTMTPFNLDDDQSYRRWRRQKLEWAQDDTLLRPLQVSRATLPNKDRIALLERLHKRGFALYQTEYPINKPWLIEFGLQFGLSRLDSNLCADPDSITTLKVKKTGRSRHYIPYTNRPINWHTDGYYNPPEQRIHSFILHCVTPAAEGGENGLFDCELAYIALRDENPDFILALSHPEAMSIPPNEEKGQLIRGWQTGPVFSVHPVTGRLHMRYTARQRNIVWRNDPVTLDAVTFLQNLLTSGENGVIWHRLAAGEGLLCNNCLHCRTAFVDHENQRRHYYRARYFDSIDYRHQRLRNTDALAE